MLLRMPEMSRRNVLVAGVSLGFAITTSGATALRALAADGVRTVSVLGDYTIRNAATGCQVSVTVRKGIRSITSNGLPDYQPSIFPNSGNPNTISAQNYSYTLPTKPKLTKITPFDIPQSFGISVDGVLFDPFAAEYWNNDRSSGWQYYALGGGVNLGIDRNNAHVQPSGAYHLHGVPDDLLNVLGSSRHSPLVGWAGDGFPIYVRNGYANSKKVGKVRSIKSSYQLKTGTRPSGPGGTYNGWFNQDYEYVKGSGDLDAANGRFCVTPDYPKGTYAYFITDGFPSVPNAFAASISASFLAKAPAGGGPPGGGPPGGGPPGGGPPGGGPPPRAKT